MPKRDRAAYMRDYRSKQRTTDHRNRRRAHTQDDTAEGPYSDAEGPLGDNQEDNSNDNDTYDINDPAKAIVKWAANHLIVPEGNLRGESFVIDEWQEHFIREALAPGIREAGLSVGRKNGKSALIAVVLLAHLLGPLHRPYWRAVVTSVTGELAKELRNSIQSIVEVSSLPKLVFRYSPTPGHILGPSGTKVNFLAADKSTGHAIGADLAIIDEAGLLQENKRGLFNAMISCTSGRDGRAIYISIQGDGPMFREVKERKEDPAVIFHSYHPDPRCKLDDEAAWLAGNPGLVTGIKSMQYMRDMSRRAMNSPSDQPSFRAYDLNLPQAPTRETICSPDDWDNLEVDELPERSGEVVLGIDLGGSSSMTAAAALWPLTGRFEVWGAFPTGTDLTTDDPDGLIRRGQFDGVGRLYERMREDGELITYPGRITPVAQFIGKINDELVGYEIVAVGADRYRRAEMEQALIEAEIKWTVIWRGQGASATADGSHDVRAFQRAVLTKQLKIKPSIMMWHAISESALSRDQRGNPALDKSRQRGRIDVLSAAVIAAGLAEITRRKKAKVRAVMI